MRKILLMIVKRYLKAHTFAIAAIVISLPPQSSAMPDDQTLFAALESFQKNEVGRVVRFKPVSPDAAPFDVIFLHVCSLSWDDIKEVDLDMGPINRFDLVFNNFNSVTTYSGPAAIRHARGSCGQGRHADLYSAAAAECYMFEELERSGFEVNLVMNHNGKYGGFLGDIKYSGHIRAELMNLEGVEVQQLAFDDTPVYNDYQTLERWLKNRSKSKAKNVVLYYNTVTLHDGSRLVKDEKWWKKDRKTKYRKFLTLLYADLNLFLDLLQSSGRNYVVVLSPEHGMALRGDKIQAAGARDIPLPQITLTPVAVKVITAREPEVKGNPVFVNKPVSFLALSHIVESFIEKSPFGAKWHRTDEFVNGLPQTGFVSENEGSSIIQYDSKYYILDKDRKWTEYTPSGPKNQGKQ
jgi:cellulose synthase operon protein YhjU